MGQDDLLDAIHWMRQLIALVGGVAWGLLPLTGVFAFARQVNDGAKCTRAHLSCVASRAVAC